MMDQLIATLSFGSMLALMASGLALTYSVSRIANFAHGDYATAGIIAYYIAALLIHGKVTSDTLNPLESWPAIALSFIAGSAAALASLWLVFKPLRDRGSTPLQLMVASIGVEIILRSILYIIYTLNFGSQPIVPSNPKLASIASVPMRFADIVAPFAAVASVIFVAVLTTKTLIGISMRAVASNPRLAEASGININLVESLAWFIGGGLAGLGGVLWFLWQPPATHPAESGWQILAFVFAAVTLGGLRSFYWTLVASFLIAAAYYPATNIILPALGLDPGLGYAIPLAVVIIVLLFLPDGLSSLTPKVMRLVEPIRARAVG